MKIYRYERKFLIEDGYNINNEEIILSNPGFFSEIHAERKINNIYLDTEEYNFFHENIHGIEKRKKIRIRWYGEEYGYIKPTLEIKEKSGQVGTKYSFNLSKIDINEMNNKDKLIQLFNKSNLPKSLEIELNSLNLTLMNTYRRKYYISSNNKIRLTIDRSLKYFDFNNLNKGDLHSIESQSNIIELKYQAKDDLYASDISNHLPWRMTRFSKYIDGIKSINIAN